MKAKYLVKGIIKKLLGIEYVYKFAKTEGTNSARYCYSVWLRHLVYAYQNGFNSIPKNLAELGPGGSLGVGISALISGVHQYFALDVIKYSNAEVNLNIFDDLVNLFKQKAPIPNEKEFPALKPSLKTYDFPNHIFPEEYLRKMLNETRLSEIKNAIALLDNSETVVEGNMVAYIVPWNNTSLIKHESLDMIISQAVLQHIDDLSMTYKSMYNWLKPNGLISHQIDFTSLGSADFWNGHWQYTDFEWKIIKGKKAFFINREPHSTYIDFLNKYNFKLLMDIKNISETKMHVNKVAKRFKNLKSEDLTISSAFIQAAK